MGAITHFLFKWPNTSHLVGSNLPTKSGMENGAFQDENAEMGDIESIPKIVNGKAIEYNEGKTEF